MSDMFSGDIMNVELLQLSAIFGFMNTEYHEAVVKRALGSRNKVSREARGLLNSAIRECIRVDGYKNTDRAPAHYLQEPVLKSVTQSDKLAGAVLKIWAESHDALGDVVVKHLDNLAMPAEYPDFSGNRFRGSWFSDVWTRETDKILERHGEFDKDDVALMLCYVSGKIPGDKKKDDVLSRSLEYLRSLPANAPEWGEAIPGFVESIQAIVETKKAQYEQANDLDTLIAEVGDVFSLELEFLQKDIASWSAAHLSPDADLSKVLQDTQSMRSLLTEYQPIRKIAPVLEEERARRPRRAKLENRLLPLIDRIDKCMNEPPTPAIEEAQQSDVPAVQEPVQESAQEPDNQLEADYIALKSEHQNEIESLKRKLHKNQDGIEKWQKEAERWRKYYIEEASNGAATAGEDEAPVIESVNDAVALAKERFDDKLLFQLNGKSRVEDNPFRHPKAVWDALHWLATTYYGFRTGESNLSSLDVSIREACKWWYRGHQSDMTMNKYEEWYTTKVENKIHWLKKHIGTGSSKDARYTIRIAFDWDKSKERVVIGFIGQHQQTDAT